MDRSRRRGKLHRVDKRSLTSGLAKHVFNPLVRTLFEAGIAPPGTAILETTGRRSGERRRTPVTDGLDGDTFWIVAEHGRRAAYVRNIEANPRVRVRIGRRWREGTARLLPDDDPAARLGLITRANPRTRINTRTVRLMQTDPLTVRVDLDGVR
jgi:deazaflavin-dependent oxidoreductase (nitroreductase family)